MGKRSPNIF